MKLNTVIYFHNGFEEIINNQIFDNTTNNGNIFIFFESVYNNAGFMEKNVFSVVDQILEAKYRIVNIIIYPKITENNNFFIKRNIGYILWCVKDEEAMFFNKDVIREKHIWKDIEWGKREKNYNPKGKDPGNVWIPTIDNGSGVIIEHIILSKEELVSRCILSTTVQGDNLYLKFPKINLKKLPQDRNIVFIEQPIEFSSSGILPIKTQVDASSTGSTQISEVYFKSSENMREIGNESIDLMVTSPPYWDLKNYFKEGQIGHESYEEYLFRMTKVWSETYRVLKNTGSMWININTRKKNKNFIPIPSDIIKECKKIGFFVKDIFIWHKSSGIPVGKNNLVDRYEYVIWFTKTESFKLNKISCEDYKNININNGILWNINRKAGSIGKDYIHPAVYPTELIDRIIKLCTDKGDTILDPFLGSGTSLISAENLDRRAIGYEYNEEFIKLIQHRFKNEIHKDYTKGVKFHKKNHKNEGAIYR